MGKPKSVNAALADNEARLSPATFASARRSSTWLRDDPRQEGRQGAGRSDLLAQAHRLDVKKTLESAIANAENNHDLDVDALVVAEAYVGKSSS
jgi:large subunit ribosomal protein L22